VAGFDAIGAVSATLRALLIDRLESPPGLAAPLDPVLVSIGLPAEGEAAEQPHVNLFLYRVAQHPFLSNQQIPGRGDPSGYGRPPLSLVLHYMLTAYGSVSQVGNGDGDFTDERPAHYLLGDAMRILHDTPIITERVELSDGRPALDTALRAEFEQIKVTLEPLSLEDVSKVWTALTRPYRAAAAYEVSVVQIESSRPPSHPQPVGEPPGAGPRTALLPGRNPRVTEVHAAGRTGSQVRTGDVLVMTGQRLGGDGVGVLLGPVDATGDITGNRDDRLTVVVPNDPALQPGVHPVRVIRTFTFDESTGPRVAFQSNAAAFVLVPRISVVDVDSSTDPVHVAVTGTHLHHAHLESLTLVGDVAVDATEYLEATSTHIVFELPDEVGPGRHQIRIRVGGAESIDRAQVEIA
jgi:hypothetical protein